MAGWRILKRNILHFHVHVDTPSVLECDVDDLLIRKRLKPHTMSLSRKRVISSCMPCYTTSTFEAAVLLISLYVNPSFPEDSPPQHVANTAQRSDDPLQQATCTVSLAGCLQAVKDAVRRLKMLAEVSTMAEVGANTLVQMLSRAAMPAARDADTSVLPQTRHRKSTSTSTSTFSHLGSASSTTEVASWRLSGELAAGGLVSMGGPLAIDEDVAGWPGYDSSAIYSRYIEFWATQRADTD